MEVKFDLIWKALNGFPLVKEYQFHPQRKWRFDRACLDRKVAFEIDGGIWGKGRHVTGVGFSNDCEKRNAATMLGWRVFNLTTNQLQVPYVDSLIKNIR